MQERNFYHAIMGAALIALGGCAGMQVGRDTVEPRGWTHGGEAFLRGFGWVFQPKGIRYYQPASFIVAYVDEAGEVKTKYLLLPNTRKRLSAQPISVLSNIGPLGDKPSGMSFAEGMLTDSLINADSAAIPKEIITQAEKVAAAFMQAAAGTAAGAAKTAAIADVTPKKLANVLVFYLQPRSKSHVDDGTTRLQVGDFELVGRGFEVEVN